MRKSKQQAGSFIRRRKAFTLVELLLAGVILVIILVGLIFTYIGCFEVTEYARNLVLVNNALQAKLESVRETAFDSLNALDGTTFTISGIPAANAIGVVEVYNTVYSDLKYVRLVVSWRQKSGRVIGEDANLNGIFELPGEDLNGDNEYSSPAELSTFISKVN